MQNLNLKTKSQGAPESTKKVLRVLAGDVISPPPVWLMRQAGRYLPEYRELRATSGGFWDMVYTPARAAEATLQPIRRFGLDAAIIFSDILTIPHAMGQKIDFIEGEGPRLTPLQYASDLKTADFLTRLSTVYEAITLTRKSLRQEGFEDTTLIGFVGAPWTLACYMLEGKGDGVFTAARSRMIEDTPMFQELIDILADAATAHLTAQIDAGAGAVQIFDSWAGLLRGEIEFRRWCIEPTKRIVENLKKTHPDIPVIGFPRRAGPYADIYARETGVAAIGLDEFTDLRNASSLQKRLPVQGNMDPAALIEGGIVMEEAAKDILEFLAARPFIFNLGHGVHKDTPPEHVADLVRIVRGHGS